MLPATSRGDFYETADRMGFVMRRLLAGRMVGMAVEGIGTGIGLWIGGVPMAALLGIITGLLTFIPNIGAFISGVLIVLVGFSAGWDTGMRSEEHTSEFQSLMRISYVVFCVK